MINNTKVMLIDIIVDAYLAQCHDHLLLSISLQSFHVSPERVRLPQWPHPVPVQPEVQ